MNVSYDEAVFGGSERFLAQHLLVFAGFGAVWLDLGCYGRHNPHFSVGLLTGVY
jgi:hypothetical protein